MRCAVLLILSCVAAGNALAQAEDRKTSIRLGAETRHVYRGVERAGDGGFVAADVSMGPWSGGLGLHQPFDGDDSNEINLGAGFAWQLSEIFVVEFSARHFWFGNSTGATIDRSFEAGAAVAWSTPGGFKPRIGYYRDFELKANTVHGSIAYEHALTKWGTYLELSLFAGWSEAKALRSVTTGGTARDAYGYFGAEAVLPYRIGELTVVSAGLTYSSTNGQARAWSPAARGGGDRVAFRLQVTWEM